MTDRIPARIIETVDPSQPIRLTPAQSGGPIHTRSFSGRFRNLRLLGGALLMLLYFGTVWLNWNGRQAVLWDLDRQQFHIFGATFWPQDFILLSAILIIAAFGLFFITVLAGRIWCGYACPQSTWTWMFMWVEKITEATACSASSSMLHAGPPPSCCAVPPSTRCGWPSAWPRRWPSSAISPRYASWWPTLPASRSVARPLSGCCSSPPRPTSMPAGCVSRCACTCAPTRASRA
jgi:hypothetical protein